MLNIRLGEIVTVPTPEGREQARVVMLGSTYEHLDIDEQFLAWVKADKILEETYVVVEWVDRNPCSHEDHQYAPVGNYMFIGKDSLRKVA